MPALDEEVRRREEGSAQMLAAPLRMISDDSGAVAGMECLRMRLGEPDASGRRRPEPIEGSNFRIDADTVIVAIGQTADLEGLPLGVGGRIPCNDSLATGTPGVFAGGDAVLGPASLVEAMAHGHRAARLSTASSRREGYDPQPAGNKPPTPQRPPASPTPAAARWNPR
jgi:NADPH-dependent glutamate synthase beta subunit-like oxidoreductase